MHIFLLGIILGWGAAIPIGPVNLQIIRRNLHYGPSFGIATGIGACTTDLVYLVLLSLGALTMLQYPTVLRCVGVIGSLVLGWFALNAFRAQPLMTQDATSKPSRMGFMFEGLVMTAFNPFTILFWSSVSSQISLIALAGKTAIWIVGSGVILGTVSWVLTLNSVLFFTRHRLTDRVIRLMNKLGGVILLGFAIYGIIRVLRL